MEQLNEEYGNYILGIFYFNKITGAPGYLNGPVWLDTNFANTWIYLFIAILIAFIVYTSII